MRILLAAFISLILALFICESPGGIIFVFLAGTFIGSAIFGQESEASKEAEARREESVRKEEESMYNINDKK